MLFGFEQWSGSVATLVSDMTREGKTGAIPSQVTNVAQGSHDTKHRESPREQPSEKRIDAFAMFSDVERAEMKNDDNEFENRRDENGSFRYV